MKRLLNKKAVKFFVIGFLILNLIWPNWTGAVSVSRNYPLLANYYLKWHLASEEEVKQLAAWDLLVLDVENQVNNPDLIRKLRTYNPDIIILAYVPCQETWQNVLDLDRRYLRRKLYSGLNESWLVHDSQGKRLNWWPNTWLVNITSDNINEKGWVNYFSQFIAENVLQSDLWDGVMLDNVWDNISWVNNGDIDLNNDGAAESREVLDSQWQKSMRQILINIREITNNQKIIVGLGGKNYLEKMNGILLEHFPETIYGGWESSMNVYWQTAGYRPFIDINNTNTGNTGKNQDYQKMRFGLGSTLLGDGFYSFDFGDSGHEQLWWYDEYLYKLGEPQGGAYVVVPGAGNTGVWRRDFTNGAVIINSLDQEKKIALGREYEKISGTEDKVVNNGQFVTNLTIAPQDGVLLFNPVNHLYDSNWSNGAYARIFSGSGLKIRNGFFVFDDQFSGGTNIVISDINSDGLLEKIIVAAGKITIYDSSATIIKEFYPYGNKYKLAVNLALYDINSDGDKEIISAPGLGGEPYIRIFDQQGRFVNTGFYAYDKKFRGGVNIAVGDVNHDGEAEIVASTGLGGTSQVKIFQTDGKLINGGLFAYNKNFRGGVSVAVGDTNGDGLAEIITGSGSGMKPVVRIFNGRSLKMEKEFLAYDASRTSGIRVVANDLDGNNQVEIITLLPSGLVK